MVFRKVARILADILDLDEEEITSNTELTPEFEIENIHIAKLVIECERKFKISIHDEKIHTFHTVGDVVKYIENTLSEEEGNISESSEEERTGWYYS
ncbi:phosphopantetheine-binding protein [Clostridium aminobutyricum]|uniref:Acyl carrier protein n=1 Tax=Clostridium aminobutyricum TaxID=33953 RepID=A0A939D7G7_CLOAM|nr:phosphopantetheine-binding protein [Clostridium aminobutyricum]MBN7772849.1 acyl carrier protein [Clostridium aminobutyricum]